MNNKFYCEITISNYPLKQLSIGTPIFMIVDNFTGSVKFIAGRAEALQRIREMNKYATLQPEPGRLFRFIQNIFNYR